AGSFIGAELPVAGNIPIPSVLRNLMVPVFVADLDGVLAFDPREVVQKLPALGGFKAPNPAVAFAGNSRSQAAGPTHGGESASRAVGFDASDRVTIVLVQAQRANPAHPIGQSVGAHIPAVKPYRGVVEEIGLDHPVKLLVDDANSDALVEACPDERRVLLGLACTIILFIAPLRPGAVADGRPGVHEVGGVHLEVG